MSELTRAAPLRRVGHKGADLIAPGNTRESFDAALAAGVDMIEFDVLPVRWPADNETPLVLAHDHDHLSVDATTLEEGLSHLASEAFGEVELDLDLKLPGYEAQVVDTLRAHGLVERTLISSQYMRSLVAIRGAGADACGSAGRCRACAATTRSRGCTCCPRCRRSRTCGAACRRSPPATSPPAGSTP